MQPEPTEGLTDLISSITTSQPIEPSTSTDLEVSDTQLRPATDDPAEADTLTGGTGTAFPDFISFAREFLLPLYPTTTSRLRDVNWKATWPAHRSVVARITALWTSYENSYAHHDGEVDIEEFLRIKADYHMRVLTSPDGILAQTKHRDQPEIPLPTALETTGQENTL